MLLIFTAEIIFANDSASSSEQKASFLSENLGLGHLDSN